MKLIIIIRLVCLVITAICSSYTDYRYGVVRNSFIAIGCMVAVVLITIDAFLNDGNYVVLELINAAIAFAISLVLYFLHIWAAGDAKLLLLFALLFPPQLYFPYGKVIACSMILPIAFSISFLYLLFDSIIRFITRKEGIEPEASYKKLKKVAVRWIACVLTITLINHLLLLAWPNIIQYPWLRIVINVCVTLVCASAKIIRNNWLLMILVALNVAVVFYNPQALTTFMWFNYLLALLFVLLRVFIDHYNYSTIPVSELKTGMVLSAISALHLSNTNNNAITFMTTEDNRSKLDNTEVVAIKEVLEADDKIEIVRRIPFAVFLSLGTIGCVIIGVIIK